MGRSLQFPFAIGTLGVPRSSEKGRALREQLEQLLFTIPGERVDRPDFGCGVQRLVFGVASEQTVVATEYVISRGIRKFIPEIQLDALRVSVDDATLSIDILYSVKSTGEELAASFTAPVEGPT